MKYTWSEFDRDTRTLCKYVKSRGYLPKTIVALARGGLPLGVKLSYILGIPLVVVSATSYSGRKQNKVHFTSSYKEALSDPVLLVDELVDTGNTLSVVKEHIESLGFSVDTAVLLYKSQSLIKPTYYAKVVSNKSWITFPWEI